MNVRINLRLEQGAATRGALLAAARSLFAQKGYFEASTEDLVVAAGVTRGALYHHYTGKEALFEAVFREVAGDLHERAASVAGPQEQHWNKLQVGLKVYLSEVADSTEMQRILLVDGPAVFGWARWRTLQSEFGLGDLIRTIEALRGEGIVRFPSALPPAHLIMAALNEAALMIAHADDPPRAARDAADVLNAMVEGLRAA